MHPVLASIVQPGLIWFIVVPLIMWVATDILSRIK